MGFGKSSSVDIVLKVAVIRGELSALRSAGSATAEVQTRNDAQPRRG